MKNLLYKNNLFYLSDDSNKNNGNTRSVSGYNSDTISISNMPHTYFNKKIVIYGRHTCPYCIELLNFLKNNDALYKKVIFVDIESEPSEFFKKTKLITILKPLIKQHNTVPIVFDKDVFIGGSDISQTYFGDLMKIKE